MPAAAPRSTAGCTAARRPRRSIGGVREYSIDDFVDRRRRAICDEVESALSVQTVPGAAHGGEREAAPRRRPHGVASRRDPALDDVSRTRPRRRRQASEHDRDLSPAGAACRRAGARRAPTRSSRRRRRSRHRADSPTPPADMSVTSGSRTCSCVPAPSRPRRSCSGPGSATASDGPWRCIRRSSWPLASDAGDERPR